MLATFDGPARAIGCGTAIGDVARRSASAFGSGSTPLKSSDVAPSSPASPST
jgi:hypothetical protein